MDENDLINCSYCSNFYPANDIDNDQHDQVDQDLAFVDQFFWLMEQQTNVEPRALTFRERYPLFWSVFSDETTIESVTKEPNDDESKIIDQENILAMLTDLNIGF